MKQIILPSTVFEFAWFVIDGFVEVFSSNQYRMSPRNLEFFQPLATIYKKSFSSTILWKIRIQRQTTRKLLGQGTKSDKWQKLQLESFFLFEIHIIFYIHREFSSPTWKRPPLPKVPIPLKIPIWPKFLLYKPSEKWLNQNPPRWDANYEYPLDRSMYIGQCKTVQAIKLKCKGILELPFLCHNSTNPVNFGTLFYLFHIFFKFYFLYLFVLTIG